MNSLSLVGVKTKSLTALNDFQRLKADGIYPVSLLLYLHVYSVHAMQAFYSSISTVLNVVQYAEHWRKTVENSTVFRLSHCLQRNRRFKLRIIRISYVYAFTEHINQFCVDDKIS